jgi:hypothetical protein
MIRFNCNILLSCLFLLLLAACSPINYHLLETAPDKSIVHIKNELSGELKSWNKIGASFKTIDGSHPGLLSNHGVAYLLPGRHVFEILIFASLDFDLFFPFSNDIIISGQSETIGEYEKITLKSWYDSEILEVDLLPDRVYEFIVHINMLTDKGEFQISFKEQTN